MRFAFPLARLEDVGRLARELAAMEEVDEPKAQEKILDILRAAAAIYNKEKVPA